DKGRLEAFSDGVIAIIITITALLIDLPEGDGWSDLLKILPIIGSYFVSFVLVGTNRVNHHHLLQVAEGVDGKVLWANLLYLFVLSFFPLATGWVGRSNYALIPVRVYAIVNLAGAFSYLLLEKAIVACGSDEVLKTVLFESRKEKWTFFFEILAFLATFVSKVHYVSSLLLLVAVIPWIIPDMRMKYVFEERNRKN
ncbi:MAG: DUF1211 domain-containing protein, partial [Erysipelotrichaceae bacterium]|nr:DUF1211 domain-containing protein [Erysipelotrichaceae bacterium]